MSDQDPAVREANSGAVDGSSSGATSTDKSNTKLDDPEVQAAIQAAAESVLKDSKKKIDEFRDNNITLSKELQGWKELGMDREALQEIVKNLSKNKEAKLAAEGKLDELFQLRTEPMRKDYETRLEQAHNIINEVKTQLQQSQEENYDLRISHRVTAAASANQEVHSQAIPTIVDMAKKVWRIEEGVPVPRRPNGTRWISKDGKSDISFEEWVESLKETVPFMFKAPSGVNARGGPGRSSMLALVEKEQGLKKLQMAYDMGLGDKKY